MKTRLKIGTRASQLAIWQAKHIKELLLQYDVESTLVEIKSDGEHNLTAPLYEMGVQGIFTKTLDTALLNNQIDIAVHSLKDVPTHLAQGLAIAAIPQRGNPYDVLVYKNTKPQNEIAYTVATSSLRRSAQWLNRYPNHKTDVLRGNINLRLEKLKKNTNWSGALFAAAGIERIGLEVPNLLQLDWMIPAPAQGAICVVAQSNNEPILRICSELNHLKTVKEVHFERNFLRKLMGGCSMPIGGLAVISGDTLQFNGCILSTDGKHKRSVSLNGSVDKTDELLYESLEILMQNGGDAILKSYKK